MIHSPRRFLLSPIGVNYVNFRENPSSLGATKERNQLTAVPTKFKFKREFQLQSIKPPQSHQTHEARKRSYLSVVVAFASSFAIVRYSLRTETPASQR